MKGSAGLVLRTRDFEHAAVEIDAARPVGRDADELTTGTVDHHVILFERAERDRL